MMSVWHKRLSCLWHEWRGLIIFAALMAVFRSSIADWNDVPSGSMRPTLVEGDRIFVDRMAFDVKLPFSQTSMMRTGDPQRGDIIVFFSPEDGTRLVKRVIGLPGDRVEMRDDRLVLNGVPVDYRLLRQEIGADGMAVIAREALPERPHQMAVLPERIAMRNFGPVNVPQGEYLVLGDNRDNSKDSRYIGFVARHLIAGRATRIVLSLDSKHYFMPRPDRLLAPLQ